ncbi:MAG: hypothetical protein IKR13_02595 [Victivallales bacterium]|nr:hypothetical protein [Victivallales bacterium]
MVTAVVPTDSATQPFLSVKTNSHCPKSTARHS